MAYKRFTENMTPEQRQKWFRQLGRLNEGHDDPMGQYMNGKFKTATGMNAAKGRRTIYEWYRSGGLSVNEWNL